jgi:hypothetical protein
MDALILKMSVVRLVFFVFNLPTIISFDLVSSATSTFCNASVLGYKETKFIETKQTLERFVTPFWSPIKIIRYLMSFALDAKPKENITPKIGEGEQGGFLLFTDLKTGKVNFIPPSRLMKES